MGKDARSMGIFGGRTAYLLLALMLENTWKLPTHNAAYRWNVDPMTDVPSWLLGSDKKWHCVDETALLTLYNFLFSLPEQ